MAKASSFNVSKGKGTAEFAISYHKCDGIDDAQWHKMIAGDHSEMIELKVSKAVAEALNDLADQSWTIKCQAVARAKHGQGRAAVQLAADGYRYGAKATSTAPVVDAQVMGLNRTQALALQVAGVTVLNVPAR